MSTLIVNGHGVKFRVTSKTAKSDKPNFAIVTEDGIKHVNVDEELDVHFSDDAA